MSNPDLFKREDIVLGDRINIIALCDKVEIKQNVSTTGGYREVFSISGKDGAYIQGIVFKLTGAKEIDLEMFSGQPVMVEGVVGEYRDAPQLIIEKITSLKGTLSKVDLLSEMVDTEILSELNDIIFEYGSHVNISYEHLDAPLALNDSSAGVLVLRLTKFLLLTKVYYSDLVREYIQVLRPIVDHYLKTEGAIHDRLDALKAIDTPMLRAVMFPSAVTPEYEEFIKLHHIIMKPRGSSIEIVDNVCSPNSTIGDSGDQ